MPGDCDCHPVVGELEYRAAAAKAKQAAAEAAKARRAADEALVIKQTWDRVSRAFASGDWVVGYRLACHTIEHEHRIEVFETPHRELWSANPTTRRATVPFVVDSVTGAARLHEDMHVVQGPCPGSGEHRPTQREGWMSCLECERDSWQRVMAVVPLDRSAFEILRQGLGSYRRSRGVDDPAAAASDVMMSRLTCAQHRQRHFARWWRQERQEAVMRELARDRPRWREEENERLRADARRREEWLS